MGGPGSGGRRKPKSAEPWTSDTIAAPRMATDAELKQHAGKIDLAQALRLAICAATVDPEILHSLEVQFSPEMRAVIVDIGSAQEKVSLEKLEAIVSMDRLKDFVGGLLERCLKKYNARANYRRLDILNAIKDELLTIVGLLCPGDEAGPPLAAVLETTVKEFGDLGETPGRVALINRLLRKVIFERIPQPETR